ncbi:MAG: penicillin-binding protein 1B [Endozoicomonas sp. (ex Botrylloides leachii)]|nr:penicillin-binding protein 1B [Endozoicomonas sp. (ex Botrylloides leachii)]
MNTPELNGKSHLLSPNQPQNKKRKIRWGRVMFASMIPVIIFFSILTWHLNGIIVRKFEGKKWAIPAKVYARPLEIYQGKRLSPDTLIRQLRQQGYQETQTVTLPGSFSRSANVVDVYSRGFQFPDGIEKAQQALISFSKTTITSLTSIQGKDLPLLRFDPQLIGGIYPANYEDRILVRLNQTPKYLIPALIAVEDRDFYHHFGISPTGILRAMFVNITAGRLVQGGSTLTQQLVKNFFLTNQQTLTRKIKEAIMSMLLEWHYGKHDILETYVNEVYMGQYGRRAIHGFALASQFYFAQPLQELDLAKIALLVAMVKGPSYYNPRRNPERSLERRNLILDVLAERGIVSKEEAENAKKQPLDVVSRQQIRTNDFPDYIDLVKKQLQENYNEQDLTSDGLQIFSNLDPIIQRAAQRSISSTLKSLDHNKQKELQGAFVVTNAQTGAVLALVGDRHAGFSGFNRALDAKRTVGSLLKPAIYLTALQHPDRYTLTTPIEDKKITIKESNGQIWEPKNDDDKIHGTIPLYEALTKSYNLAAVNLGMSLGIPEILKTIKSLGINAELSPYPSVLLGGISLLPFEIAQMYQTIASGGFKMPLRSIDAVLDAHGNRLKRYGLSVERTVDPDSMELLRFALGLTMTEGTGRRAYQVISPSIALGGKTGTSNELRDSWFAGYSNNIMAVSWVGYDDNSPTKLYGSSGALLVWRRFMASIPLTSVTPLPSKNIELDWVNPEKNALTESFCAGAKQFPYIKGSAPEEMNSCVAEKGRSVIKKIKSWFQ